MALDPEIMALMRQAIVVQPVAVRRGDGSVIYGEPQEFLGWVQWKKSVSEAPDGRTTVSRGTVNLRGVFQISVDALLTLPDGSQPPLLGTQDFEDEDGPCYTQLIFE